MCRRSFSGNLGTYNGISNVEAALDIFRHQPRNDISGQYGSALQPGTGHLIGVVVITTSGDVYFTPASTKPDPIFVPPPSNIPVIAPGQTVAGTVGVPLNYNIQATNSPIIFSLAPGSSLPNGLALNPATGLINGVPTTAGSTNASFTATNGDGTSQPVPIAFEIAPPAGPVNAAGRYNGIIGALGSMLPSTPSVSIEDGFLGADGGITLTVDSRNNFTGTLFHNGLRYAGRGTVAANGDIVNSIWTTRGGTATLNLALVTNGTGAAFYRGNAVIGALTLDALAGLNVFDRRSNPYTTTPGPVTVLFPLDSVAVPIDNSLQGAGSGTGSIDASGNAKFAGTCADGTRWSFSPPVWAATGRVGEQILLWFAQPYRGGGGIAGWATRDTTDPDSDWKGLADWAAPAPTRAGSRFPGGIRAVVPGPHLQLHQTRKRHPDPRMGQRAG